MNNEIKIYVTSAFSKDNAGGNKAGVVLDHPELRDDQKKAISAELNYSETAFVTESDKADFKLEYFTPTEEVPLCGHATIATFATLKFIGRISAGNYTMETKAGILTISVDEDGMVMMQQNKPEYYDLLEGSELEKSMGLPSRITVKVDGEEEIDRIFVGGYGYLVEERMM